MSSDGEEGFPGTVLASVSYMVTEDNRVMISMTGVTDQATPVNMANHAYYNLAGHKAGAQQVMLVFYYRVSQKKCYYNIYLGTV